MKVTPLILATLNDLLRALAFARAYVRSLVIALRDNAGDSHRLGRVRDHEPQQSHLMLSPQIRLRAMR